MIRPFRSTSAFIALLIRLRLTRLLIFLLYWALEPKIALFLGDQFYWTIYGILLTIWASTFLDDTPVFVRSYGDQTYMLENNHFLPKLYYLGDRIFVCLFGVDRNKIVVVYPFSITLLKMLFGAKTMNVTLDGIAIIRHKDHDHTISKIPSTHYLWIIHSSTLYAISDLETLIRIQAWAKLKSGHLISQTPLSERKIRRNALGCVLTPAKLWTDADILRRTDHALAHPKDSLLIQVHATATPIVSD